MLVNVCVPILCLCFSFLKARLWRDQDSGSSDDACFLGLVKVWQLYHLLCCVVVCFCSFVRLLVTVFITYSAKTFSRF